MANLESQTDLKEYCLRKLGKPLINIEVHDDQINDCIDDAVQMFTERHYEGVQEIYRTYTITDRDVRNGYITVPDEVVAIVDMIDPGTAGQTGSSLEEFERLNYRLANSDIFNAISGRGGSRIELTSYVLTMQNIDNLLSILSPTRNYYFNAVTRQMRTSGTLVTGNFIILHTYESYDPELYVNIYNDRWIKKYTHQLIKKQWGSNLKKFGDVQLPGGIVLNGKEIYDEAVEEITKLEEEFSLRYEYPVDFFTGPSFL